MDILYGLALSLHLGFEGDYNSIHPQIRVQENNFIAGAYYNSEYNTSFYGGFLIERGRWNYEIGAVTGYNRSVYPFFRSTYDLDDNILGYIAPAAEGDSIGLVLGIEFWSK